MSELANQMQAKMNSHLQEKRIDTMLHTINGGMIDAANRIQKRPSLKGCDALEKTQSHDLMKANKNDDGFQMMSLAAGGGGLIETVADAALDHYSNRKATQIRPQDEQELEPKHEAKIRQDNFNDMKLFFDLAEKREALLLLKDTCEHDATNEKGHWNAVIDTNKDEIVGVKFEQYSMTPKYNPHMTPEQLIKFEQKNAQDRIAFTANGVTPKYDQFMTPEEILAMEHEVLQFTKPMPPAQMRMGA